MEKKVVWPIKHFLDSVLQPLAKNCVVLSDGVGQDPLFMINRVGLEAAD